MWRASGPRTESRRDMLLTRILESHYGPAAQWPVDIRYLQSEISRLVKQRTRIDELQYS
jgi:hypothetical protein